MKLAECTDATERLAVRCCGPAGEKVKMSDYGISNQCDNTEKTFAEAETICNSGTNGLRLCTADEVDNDKAVGTGCSFDPKRIWTSSTTSAETGGCSTGSAP